MSTARMINRATITDARSISIAHASIDDPKPDEATLRVESCGICGSDLTMYKGMHPVIKPPIMFGHEVIGIIERLGSSSAQFAVGDRVAFLPQVGCGECDACRRGDHRLCSRMKLIGGQIPGGMGEMVNVPIANLISMPGEVPEPLRILAEPLAVGVHAVGRARVTAGSRCLVMGGGPIGLLLAFVLRHRKVADIFILDLDERRVELARAFGFRAGVTPPDGPFDTVFECVGGGGAAKSALEMVCAAGMVVLVGVASPELTFAGMLLQRQERTVTGSHMYTRTEFEEAVTLLGDGIIPHDSKSLARLFERGDLSQVADMMHALDTRSSAAIKMVVDFP